MPRKDVQNPKITMKKHFHFRYSCRLCFLSHVLDLLRTNFENSKISLKKYDYWQIINENFKVILLFSWKVESVIRTLSNICNGIFCNIKRSAFSVIIIFLTKTMGKKSSLLLSEKINGYKTTKYVFRSCKGLGSFSLSLRPYRE